MPRRKMFAAVCGVLCAAAGFLVIYGMLEDIQTFVILGMVTALAAVYFGDRVRKESSS